jgi:hypothetical protein
VKSAARVVTVLALALPAALASAQDAPGGAPPPAPPGEAAKPAEKAGEAATAKKERKVDPKATAAIERYGKLLLHPGSMGAKELSAQGEVEVPDLPDPVIVKPKWTAKDGFALDIEVSEGLRQQFGEDAVEMIRKQFEGLVKMMVGPLFEEPGRESVHYDLAAKDEEGGVAVTMIPFDAEKAEAEKQTLHFGADGLLRKAVVSPKLDPEDPNSAMMAGVEIEVTVEHERRGEKWISKGFTALLPMGEMKSSATWYEGPGGLPLAKDVELTMPMLPEPVHARLYDYVIDGKKVAGTEKPKAEAPAAPPAKEPAPADPAAPVPPAKDAPK